MSQLSSVRAAFQHNFHNFIIGPLEAFGTVNGVAFSREKQRIVEQLHTTVQNIEAMSISSTAEGIQRIGNMIEDRLSVVKHTVRSIPCDVPGFILDANTPFQAYRRLHAIVQGAETQVDLFDPYLDGDVYHRYLDDVDANVKITVVMSKDITLPNHAKRLARIVSISKLFAAERPTTYRLLAADIHDRHLRADNKVFHLGGSAKDMAAKNPYTVSNVEAASAIGASLDAIITGGEEWFGPTTTIHRTS